MRTQNIHIPAKLETTRIIRLWYCYNTLIRWRWISLTDYYEDIEIGDTEIPGHDQIVQRIQQWRFASTPPGYLPRDKYFVILAYQVLDVELLSDDREEWHHESKSTRRVAEAFSPKVFVFKAPWVHVMRLAELAGDVAWVKSFGEHMPAIQMRDRHAGNFTCFAYDDLLKHNPDLPSETPLLKLGSGAYVIVDATMSYSPESSLNQGLEI